MTILYTDNKGKKERADEVREIAMSKRNEEKELENELKEREESDSFYQKLDDGFDVDILVVGDSIGAQSWSDKIGNYISDTYQIDVNITNVSMGDNTSYAGYVRTMALEDNVDYDLAIICYGQNDDLEKFSLYYESILRALRNKYSKCSLISVLESSQREYTEKIKIIQSLAKHYGIIVADTIEPFSIDYNNYTDDGVHPNEAGQELYAEIIEHLIDEAVDNKLMYNNMEVMPINDEVTKFDTFKWYDVSRFERTDDITFVLKEDISGIMGIDMMFLSKSDNMVKIYVDNELFETTEYYFKYDFSQRNIRVISESCNVNNELKIVFENKEAADGFYGVCFSGIV